MVDGRSTKVAKWLWQTSTSTRTTTDEVMILQCLFAAKLRKGVTPSNESQLQAFVNDMQAKTAALNAKPDTTSVANSAEHTLPTLRLFVLDGGVTSQADWDRCLAHVQREVVNGGIIACIPPHILLSEQSDHVQRVDWNERLLSIASHVTEHLFWDPETMTQYTVLVARFSTPAVHLAAAPPQNCARQLPDRLDQLATSRHCTLSCGHLCHFSAPNCTSSCWRNLNSGLLCPNLFHHTH